MNAGSIVVACCHHLHGCNNHMMTLLVRRNFILQLLSINSTINIHTYFGGKDLDEVVCFNSLFFVVCILPGLLAHLYAFDVDGTKITLLVGKNCAA